MILCCGEALIDMLPRRMGILPEEQGGNSSGSGGTAFLPCPGGSPYNTAVAIGRLGVPVGFLGRLSTDFFGDILVKRLVENGVSTDCIVRSGENSSLAFVKLDQDAEPQYIFYTEGSADRSLSPADLPPALPGAVDCILFGSISMTMEPIASAIESLIRREAARGTGTPVISLDPNIRPFMIRNRESYVQRFEGWLRDVVIVKVSEADLHFIYPGPDPEGALERLLTMGPQLVVSTLGPRGARALLRRDDGSLVRATAPVVDLPVADTIGAGDTFHGAFLAWLERRGRMSRSALAALGEAELSEALFFANKAASLVCSRHGAEPPALDEVERLVVR
ncbi:MAG: carbohydrate kinase [Spirochaetaceae bacterium]|jgi:fructokinase|nr:carbohydrate kinase [Spirochaetaceae bacterium]